LAVSGFRFRARLGFSIPSTPPASEALPPLLDMALLIRVPEGLEPSRTARCSARVYHCFDRIVIQGYLPLLTRPEHIVHFFRDVHGQYPITPEVLARRTLEYRGWVEGYARNHKIPVLKAEKGVSREDCVRPHLQRMERRNQHGVYCIFTGMEMGSTFNSRMPRFPTDDPNYRIIRRVPSRYLHYYFYIRDPVIGPLAMCVGTYLPFQTTYYLNGHNFIEIELRRQGVAFRKDDNAFLSTEDPKALQAAADKLSASIIEKRLNYWSWLLAPKFSDKDRRAINLRRAYSINQIEYCDFVPRNKIAIMCPPGICGPRRWHAGSTRRCAEARAHMLDHYIYSDTSHASSASSSRQTGLGLGTLCSMDGGSQRRRAASFARTVISA
jgi:hypothetical protein